MRHPFERLVSAFRDKLERTCNKYYLTNEKKEIVAKYRHEYLKHFPAESLNKVNHFGALIPNEDKKCSRASILPTFWEFVQWLLHNDNHLKNEHWIPVGNFCGMCEITYDYIIKFEHFGKFFTLFCTLSSKLLCIA